MPIPGPRRFVVRESNAKARPWAQAISSVAADHHRGNLLTGPVSVAITFHFAHPKGHYGTGRNAGTLRLAAPREMTTTPDVDKLARCALDALTGIVIRDDAQIVDLHAGKRYGEPERAEITIRELNQEATS
jgi:Holliday junction resolvase RusA-like endonuclease